jgi:hypothetical protein
LHRLHARGHDRPSLDAKRRRRFKEGGERQEGVGGRTAFMDVWRIQGSGFRVWGSEFRV